MKRILALALAALAAACGSDTKQDRPIAYGAPLAPTPAEQDAMATASSTLQASLAYQPSTEPTAGAAGIGDQLASTLGGTQVTGPAKTGAPSSAKLTQGTTLQAFDTGGMNPACVVPSTELVSGVTVSVWTWGADPNVPCVVTISSVDPMTSDTMDMTVTVAGWLKDDGQGKTWWSIGEGYDVKMVSSANGTVTADGTATLTGQVKVDATARTIDLATASGVDMTTHYMGLNLPEGLATTTAASLGYDDPFCISSGKLTVEQHWTKRPMGMTQDDLPNAGWIFEWTGCAPLGAPGGTFTVAHGS